MMCMPLPVVSAYPPPMAFLPAGQTAFCVAGPPFGVVIGAEGTSAHAPTPLAPAAPAGPVAPVGPIGPAGPVAPVAPAGPVAPAAPDGPGGPAGPRAPARRVLHPP